MLKKTNYFVWSNNAESSFTKVKKVADFPKQIFLFVDRSTNAVGACLAQLDDNNHYEPVCYFIRKLSNSKKKI